MKQEGKFRYENIIYLLLLLQCCLFLHIVINTLYSIKYFVGIHFVVCLGLLALILAPNTKMKIKWTLKALPLYACLIFFFNVLVCTKFLHFPLVEAILVPLYSSGHVEAPNDLWTFPSFSRFFLLQHSLLLFSLRFFSFTSQLLNLFTSSCRTIQLHFLQPLEKPLFKPPLPLLHLVHLLFQYQNTSLSWYATCTD